jgi:Ceramidase
VNKNAKTGIVLLIVVAAIATTFTLSPISQPPEYFNFADSRFLWSIPNFGDVVSNLPFSIVGILGLLALRTHWQDPSRFIDSKESLPFAIAFTGLLLLGPGSAYFHLTPANDTLVWDRLPMTLVFMAFFSIVIAERIHLQAGLYLLPVLLVVGIGSVIYWGVTESAGHGDLRPYGLVQFLPALVIPIILILFPPRYSGVRYLIEMIAWYGLAKLFELYDAEVYAFTAHFVSGHTLKHLLTSLGAFGLVKYVRNRQRI